MKTTFFSKNVTIPERVSRYAEAKLNEMDRLFQEEPKAAVVFSMKDGKSCVELTVYFGNAIIRTAEETSDMLVSVDAAAVAVRRQLRKNRSRLEKFLNVDAFEAGADELIFVPEVDQFEEPAYQVVRAKEFEFGPMTVQEAILRMNLIGHDFFAFRNAERDNQFSVVYRRSDGSYGIIMDKQA